MVEDLVILGAGGHAREMLNAVLAVNSGGRRWNVLGFLADGEAHPDRAKALGAEILGPVEALTALDARYLVGIGTPADRARVDSWASQSGHVPAVLVHPDAVVGHAVVLREGSYVAAGAVLTTNVALGRHTHVNVGASVSHDCTLGSYCSLGPGARLAGRVALGDLVEVGMGAVVLPDVRVGDRAVVGAGAVVIEDVADGATVAGVPAIELPRR